MFREKPLEEGAQPSRSRELAWGRGGGVILKEAAQVGGLVGKGLLYWNNRKGGPLCPTE